MAIWASALFAGLMACATNTTETVAGGGFETTDLAVGVYYANGEKAVGATVWLLKSQGDSLPALVIDSARVDSNGMVHFRKSTSLRVYGLEGLKNGNMGLAYDSGQGIVRFVLSPAALVSPVSLVPASQTVPSDPLRQTFVLGSHFSASANDTIPVLWVPIGDHKMYLGGPKGQPPTLWQVKVDSLGKFTPGSMVPPPYLPQIDTSWKDSLRAHQPDTTLKGIPPGTSTG
jgi:hypothetical protein